MDLSPSHDNKEVQAIPSVSKVTLRSKNPQSHHLDNHLHSEKGKDAVIKCLWTQ